MKELLIFDESILVEVIGKLRKNKLLIISILENMHFM